MSLRVRLNLLITLCFLLILLLGTVFVMQQAQRAVQEEVSSTAHLTLRLIEIALSHTAGEGQDFAAAQQDIVRQIAGLGETRHLHVEIRRHGIPLIDTTGPLRKERQSGAPDWFVNLVRPAPMEFRQLLTAPGQPETEILIRADPIDEIDEVWTDVRVILGLLLIFVVIANLLVYFTIGRGLAPIDAILRGLGGIERGDYRLRLPRFRLPELARISEKFNHMAEVLQRSREENRLLTQRSLAIQERERRNLAHELHDELGQSISAIKAVAASINQQSERGGPVAEGAETIVAISNNMYDVARQMMRRLRPVVLDELGLVAALQEMIDDWNARHEDLFCHFSCEGDLAGLGEEMNITVYRIVQEGLTNISKHSDANRVDLEIRRLAAADGDVLDLKLVDDGLGFDPGTTRWGLGLLGMRERTEAVGGNFSLATQPGQGVSIHITLPVTGTKADD